MADIHILVVEDERIVAEDIRRSLKSLGYSIAAIVSSGEDALSRARELRPDLVLMDIVLEGHMNGIEAARRIRSRYNIPVIYLTAYDDEVILDQAKITEPFGYIVKPFEERALRSAIEVALYKHQTETELKQSREQLRNLAAHLESVREDDRTMLARAVHDELGQVLTVLKMDLSWLGKKIPADQRTLIEKVAVMTALIDGAIKTVKRITAELRPALLDDLGLVAAVEWQTKEFQNRTGISCRMSISPSEGQFVLDKDRSIALFRIFQEALSNVVRHSGATEVSVQLCMDDRGIELSVRDNGREITREQIFHAESYGIMGMKERAQFLGGELDVRGVRGKGTVVFVRIPAEKKGVEK